MHAGRSRWKRCPELVKGVENEAFALIGSIQTSSAFGILLILLFLVDQIQQLKCSLFQATAAFPPSPANGRGFLRQRFWSAKMRRLDSSTLSGLKF